LIPRAGRLACSILAAGTVAGCSLLTDTDGSLHSSVEESLPLASAVTARGREIIVQGTVTLPDACFSLDSRTSVKNGLVESVLHLSRATEACFAVEIQRGFTLRIQQAPVGDVRLRVLYEGGHTDLLHDILIFVPEH
jgi:hypothetical protein